MKIEIIFILSIVLSIFVTKYLIRLLQKNKVGQPIREEGNKEHYAKAGTPTMGGLGFGLVFIILTLLANGFSFDNFMIVISTLAFGAIGFLDDYSKVKKKENMGLNERQKLILQFAVALVISLIVYFVKEDMNYLRVPFVEGMVYFGIFAIPIYVIALVGATNAVNLTDGIDGLLSSVSIPVFIGISMITLTLYSDVSSSAIIFAGVLLGFLAYNSNPASVFMGDTGSMAIGGAITAMMILSNNTIYLLILGGIYVAEALSVIIQVAYYKRTKKRIFLMSPFHHHYELKGYKEPKIVAGFTIASVILTALTVYLIG